MKLKVCGVNDAAFAVEAARLGADYLGFIFAPSSPRAVTPEAARRIVRAVREAVSTPPRLVGVFVDQTVAEILSVLRTVGLDIAQLHRRATAADVAALRPAGREVWTLAGGAPGDGVLFDSSHGDGETALRRGPYAAILAGGVSAANLAEKCACAPDVLDVSGSLESAPGVKSLPRLRAFVAAWVKCRRRDFPETDERLLARAPPGLWPEAVPRRERTDRGPGTCCVACRLAAFLPWL